MPNVAICNFSFFVLPCSGAQLENLNGALAGFLKGGEVIKLTTAVDPALIGGMTVR